MRFYGGSSISMQPVAPHNYESFVEAMSIIILLIKTFNYSIHGDDGGL